MVEKVTKRSKEPQPHHESGMDLYGQLATVKLVSVEEIE